MDWLKERLRNQHSTNKPVVVTAAVGYICPTCGVSGSDPCVTPAGKVKDTPHAKRGS